MKKCGVYGIFNTTNGKVLVGSSSDLTRRWTSHKSDVRHGKHGNPHFQSAWNKYGESAFEFRILEECPESMLLVREDSWMNYYHSLYDSHGYNLQTASRIVQSSEASEKKSRALKGRKMSEAFCQQQRIRVTGSGNPMYGKHPSEETRKKWRKHRHRVYTEEDKKRLREMNLGRVRSEEYLIKQRASHKGQVSGFKGKHHSNESLKKNSDAHKALWKSNPDIPPSFEGRHHSEESRKKQSDAAKAWIERKRSGIVVSI